jgi:hypothetical protein
MRLSYGAMGEGLVSTGAMTQDDLEWLMSALDDPDSVFFTPMIAAWGRKPKEAPA